VLCTVFHVVLLRPTVNYISNFKELVRIIHLQLLHLLVDVISVNGNMTLFSVFGAYTAAENAYCVVEPLLRNHSYRPECCNDLGTMMR